MEFQIGNFKDKVLCDIMPMNVCHILLGRPWQFDRRVVHDGRKNWYTLVKDGVRHTLFPLEEKYAAESSSLKVSLLSGKKIMQQIEEQNEVRFALVINPRLYLIATSMLDFLVEIQDMLEEFNDIIMDELPN